MDQSTRTTIEQEMTAHLMEVSAARGKPAIIDPDQSFFEAGILDSLSLLDFVSFVEQRYGLDVEGRDIVPENFGSVRSVADYVCRRLHQATPR
jgi:acyl carrier protein